MRFQGQTFTYIDGKACLRCIFKEPPAKEDVSDPAEEGIIGITPGIIGTIQAAEALRYILGIGELLINRILFFDGLGMNFRTLKITRDPDCPLCGNNPIITGLMDNQQYNNYS